MQTSKIIHRSASAVTIRILVLLFILDTGYALLILAFIVTAPALNFYPWFVAFLLVLHTIKYIVLSIILLRTLMKWLGTSYELSGERLITHAGIYGINEKVYELEHLKELKIHQDWLGRLLHFGTITLELSSSGFRDTLELQDVQDPVQHEEVLRAKLGPTKLS